MPKPFMDCVKSGGKVRTKKLSAYKYIHLCFKNGKTFPGEVKTKKKRD